MKVSVTFRRISKQFEVEETDHVRDLLLVFAREFDVPSEQLSGQGVKLLCRGRDIARETQDLRTVVGEKGKVLVMLQDTTDVASIQRADENAAKRPQPARLQALNISSEARKKRLAAGPSISRYIHRIHPLTELPRHNEADAILKKVASDPAIVAILEKYRWNIGQLSELSPLQQKLLGLNKNKGEEILLRLRHLVSPMGEDALFLPYTEIIDTMLHELSHCVHGPHDEKFYTLYRELHAEYKKADWRGGLGKKVGGTEIYKPPPEEVSRSGGGGGRVLGGNVSHYEDMKRQGYSAAQIAGRSAVIRLSQAELHIERNCGSCTADIKESSEALPTPIAVVANREEVEEDEEEKTAPQQPVEDDDSAMQVEEVEEEAGGGGGGGEDQEMSEPGQETSSSPVHCPICCVELPQGCTARYISNHVESCANPKPPPEMRCPVCTKLMPEGSSERFFQNHVEGCVTGGNMDIGDDEDDDDDDDDDMGCLPPQPVLRLNGGVGTSSSSSSASTFPSSLPQPPLIPEAMPTEQQNLSTEGDALNCPICQETFPPGSSERYVNNHVDQCIARG